MENGTVVLWQQLDRVVDIHDDIQDAETVFNNKFIDVAKHIEMVFHRYMSGPAKLNISIGRTPLKPWDPYLTSNQFTQELSTEKYEDGSVKIIPYILPHISKRTATETRTGAGPAGWNAQQGFYIYRNRRMIVSGGYLDFNLKPEEHYKLGRIMVDLKNDMDTDWRLDVRKAVAIPPDRLRAQLEKVAKATREEAVKIYRARSRRTGMPSQKNVQEVWTKRRKGDKIVYEINRDNESIKRILTEIAPPERWIRKLFGTIERTIPHRDIIIDSCSNEDCHVDLPPDISRPDQGLIDMCIEIYSERRERGKTHDDAAGFVLSIEPFNTHPAFRAALDKIAEGGDSRTRSTNEIIDMSYGYMKDKNVTQQVFRTFIDRMKHTYPDNDLDEAELFRRLESIHSVTIGHAEILDDAEEDHIDWFNTSTGEGLKRKINWHFWPHYSGYLTNRKFWPKPGTEYRPIIESNLIQVGGSRAHRALVYPWYGDGEYTIREDCQLYCFDYQGR